MLYGDQKSRQMARSILPSTSHSSAWRRTHIHRAARHEARASLRHLVTAAEAWDDGVEFGERHWRTLRSVVQDRRSADKLNPFIRWAAARSQDLAPETRLDSLRGVLPTGLIGDHALDHLQRDRRITPRAEHHRPWVRHTVFLDRGLLASLLRKLLDAPDGVRWLHRCLKTASRVVGTRRVTPGPHRLLGHPQVLTFLDAVERDRVARFVVSDFCREYQRTGDAEHAALTASASVTVPDWDWFYDHHR